MTTPAREALAGLTRVAHEIGVIRKAGSLGHTVTDATLDVWIEEVQVAHDAFALLSRAEGPSFEEGDADFVRGVVSDGAYPDEADRVDRIINAIRKVERIAAQIERGTK